ncbi:probable cytochrome P450 305a1 [Culex quinquefasciatus]|uniref:probable cytochrome P450 305a1 n=1 Tax=Culex quinquefasciatus TaxID=7176 RepID=UPI0018E3E6A6|nr:probable cytochrome P450 305a1 [Culex quinquefasciatus]
MLWIFGFALFLVLLWVDTIKPSKYPPGPRWIPWFGNTFILRMLARKYGGQHGVFDYLSQKYNSAVIGFRMGRERGVAIRGYTLARQALISEDLQGRPDNYFARLRTGGKRLGVTFVDGDHGEEQRNFVVRTLKELGMGRSRMNDLIQRELHELIQIIDETTGPIQPNRLLQLSVINVLWTLATGERIERHDDHLQSLLDVLKKRSTMFDIAGGLLNQMPWLRFVAPNWSGYNIVVDFNWQLISFFSNTIQKHNESYTDEVSSNDLIFAYMRETRKHSTNPNSNFTEDQMIMTILDLFIAGANNTSTIVDLLLIMMVNRPDIQAKVHQEIDQHSDPIRWTDHSQLPYVEAVIMEVQRFFHTAAISGPRRAIRDCELGGYRIPKDTSIFVDLKSVHMDADYWNDPEVFRPERFLGEDGTLANTERLLSFSLGKRRCLGEALARACIFNYFAGILQQFTVELPDGEDIMPSLELTPGISYMPKPYKVIFKRKYTQTSHLT